MRLRGVLRVEMGFVGTWPLWAALLFVVGGLTALGLLGAVITRRIAPVDVLQEHNDRSGFILAIVGVVYAVLLGFVAIDTWERYDLAEVRTYSEATNLTELYRDADAFPQREVLRRELRRYTESIVNVDYPSMLAGRDTMGTRPQIEGVGAIIRHLTVSTMAQQNVQLQMLGALQSALADRDTRLSMSATGLNVAVWIVLIVGAILTIGFTYLFGFKHARLRAIMIGALAAMIGLVLFLAMSLDYPFRGDVRVGTEAFDHAMKSYDVIDKVRP